MALLVPFRTVQGNVALPVPSPRLFEAPPVPDNHPSISPPPCGSWPHQCPTHTAAVADGDMGECPFKEGSAAGGGDLLCFLSTFALSLVSEKQNSQDSVGMSPMGVKPTFWVSIFPRPSSLCFVTS